MRKAAFALAVAQAQQKAVWEEADRLFDLPEGELKWEKRKLVHLNQLRATAKQAEAEALLEEYSLLRDKHLTKADFEDLFTRIGLTENLTLEPRNEVVSRIGISLDAAAQPDATDALAGNQVLNGQLVFLHHVDGVIESARHQQQRLLERWHCRGIGGVLRERARERQWQIKLEQDPDIPTREAHHLARHAELTDNARLLWEQVQSSEDEIRRLVQMVHLLGGQAGNSNYVGRRVLQLLERALPAKERPRSLSRCVTNWRLNSSQAALGLAYRSVMDSALREVEASLQDDRHTAITRAVAVKGCWAVVVQMEQAQWVQCLWNWRTALTNPPGPTISL